MIRLRPFRWERAPRLAVLFSVLLAPFFLLVGQGCRKGDSFPPEELSVLVTVPPLSGLVRAVAGPECRTVVLVPPGKEPETFMPTPSQMREIARCSVFFRVGLPAEEAVAGRLASLNPRLRPVDLRTELPIAADPPEEDEPAGDSDHHQEGADPHVWMSPSNLAAMARTVEETFSALDPENASLYRERSARFRDAAETLRRETAERLAPLSPRVLYVFHPAYGYYCAEFGIRQRAVEAGGKSPKSKDFVELLRSLREENAEKIFVQPEFSRTAAEKIASELNLRIEVHSPLGEDPLEDIETLTDALAR